MLIHNRSVVTVKCVMLVKTSESTNRYSVELFTLIIVAYAELWIGVYKGKRKLTITCPESKIGGRGTPLISLS